jgi:hypothetical protein
MGENSTFNDNSDWEVPNYQKINNFSSHSFEFDGVDDYVDCGDSNTFSFGDGGRDSTFSISCWVYYNGDAGWKGVVSKWDASATKKEYLFYLSANKLRILLGDSSSGGMIGYESSGSFTLNTWQHVVMTYDGSSAVAGLTLYVDGSAIAVSDISSGSYTAMEDSDQPLWIGNGEDGAGTLHPFDGNIDGVSIWSAELTSSNVNSIFNSGVPNDVTGLSISGLVGYWRMGEGATWSSPRWSIPDDSEYSNNGVGENMDAADRVNTAPDNDMQLISSGMDQLARKFTSPTNLNRGLSSSMDVEDKTNNAPDNVNQGLSVNMESEDVVADVPT